MKESLLDLGPWLQRLRAHAGLTQQELALRISVNRVSVSRWERGKTYPPREIRECLNDVAREFDFNPITPRWRTVARPAASPEVAR